MKISLIGDNFNQDLKNEFNKAPFGGIYDYVNNLFDVKDNSSVVIDLSSSLTDLIDFKKNNSRKLLVVIRTHINEGELKDILFKSKANIAFNMKGNLVTAYTQDGAMFDVSISEQVSLINKLINESFYATNIVIDHVNVVSLDERFVLNNYPKYEQDGRVYGTFAIRRDKGFITTTRGKSGGLANYCQVFSVDHDTLKINSSQKATLNAPLLDMLIKRNSHINYILHGHELIGKIIHNQYEFAGTKGDNSYCVDLKAGEAILLSHHGYIIGFNCLAELKEFLYEK